MITRRAPARGLGLLLLLCLALGGVVAVETRYPDALILHVQTSRSGQPARPDPTNAQTTEDTTYRPPLEATFQVIEERPLFAPDRRPTEASPEPVDEGPPPPQGLDGLALTGIIRAGEEWVAIVEPTGPPRPGNEALSLRVGDNLRGWTVQDILEDRMVLGHGTRNFEMELTEDPARRRNVPPRGTNSGAPRAPATVAPQPTRQQPASNR